MAKKTSETQTTDSATGASEAVMRQLDDAGLGSLRWMGTAWFEAVADMNSEVVSFVADRIKEDVKTQHALLHCSDAEELQKAQFDFIEKAFEQYTAETGKLIKMGMDMLPTSLAGTKHTPL
ncbi:phasin family protein [Yoonia sp.]|jgi:hypothetical protein|uniref:phasin family protein n=1 Tax=Yoonia sp. TaxID=2212373 RepID=UPI0025F37CBF|nr:phasin family protein [Yoonia sp.]